MSNFIAQNRQTLRSLSSDEIEAISGGSAGDGWCEPELLAYYYAVHSYWWNQVAGGPWSGPAWDMAVASWYVYYAEAVDCGIYG